ncbi:DUF1365 domain-containing protein [Catellatospora citrea]|uniref:DUF1365 domain-containing protein n=1 Tax=Catellatospora citrea TaxID=53366 RepID=UPI0033C84125
MVTSAWAAGATLYECRVRHVRTTPRRHTVRMRTYQWLIDLDTVPRPPWPLRALARFESRDHMGDPGRSLRANVEALLAGAGVDLGGGRILMLAHARVLGYVFNPLTVYWCHDRSGVLVCVVAEVHNTYGQRHCYLLRPEPDGRLYTDKRFYVSPFLPVDGRYLMRMPVPDRRLALAVALHRGGGTPLVATVVGVARAAGTAALLRMAVRHPLSTLTVTLAIRAHGIALLLRGLRIIPRPPRDSLEGSR